MPKKPLKLLHVTDPHLCARPESRMRGLNTYDTLLAVIEQVRTGKLRPDAVLATGDLVQDGTREGYDLALNQEVARRVRVPIVASGGAGNLDHIYEVLTEGEVSAALAASIFHFQQYSIPEVKDFLRERGVVVRQ